MSELIRKARYFATEAHKRINHRRKYTQQPYHVHLKAVADLVATVSEDPEMIAAAWLHDTVEDTPATFHDIEEEFGPGVAHLVAELTDVSKQGDGNRAARKAIDREHAAQASARAKTIKLADIIDNCQDICSNDPRFARIYVTEMAALLEVLGDGDAKLYRKAQTTLERCASALGTGHTAVGVATRDEEYNPAQLVFSEKRALRLFTEVFSAEDIAEPLRSFDAASPAEAVAVAMAALDVDVVGVRTDGVVNGYVRRADLGGGSCGDWRRRFGKDQVIDGRTSLSDVIRVLTHYDHCFLALLGGDVAGVIVRADIQKPIVRMWLFGMITVIELALVERIRAAGPDGGWTDLISPQRLQKAETLRQERRRRGQHCDLLDCLQLSDKARIAIEIPEQMRELGFETKGAAKRAIKELESLRNNLAHAQDIVSNDWPQIARMTRHVQDLVVGA